MADEEQNRRNFGAQLDRLDHAANNQLGNLATNLWKVQWSLEQAEPMSTGGVAAGMDRSYLELTAAIARRQNSGCDVALATQETLADIVRVYRAADGQR